MQHYTNEFCRPISSDFVPRGSICGWCGKPAERQLTAIGGSSHNGSGLFCLPCGEQFTQAIVNALNVTAIAQPEVG